MNCIKIAFLSTPTRARACAERVLHKNACKWLVLPSIPESGLMWMLFSWERQLASGNFYAGAWSRLWFTLCPMDSHKKHCKIAFHFRASWEIHIYKMLLLWSHKFNPCPRVNMNIFRLVLCRHWRNNKTFFRHIRVGGRKTKAASFMWE